ncbi:MAG: CmcJ/NvfI family oxidoreductase [Acidimicrobiia bacterium]
MDHDDGAPGNAATVTASVAHARRDAAGSAPGNADLLAADVLEMHDVEITDARPIAARLDIDVDGFVLRERPSGVANFFDLDQIESRYLGETLALVHELSGARDMVVLEHVIRGPQRLAREHPEYPRHMLGWGLKAHLDADEATFRTWAANVCDPVLIERCGRDGFAVYNTWRSINRVEKMPMAFCHAATVHHDDLVPAFYDGRFPGMVEAEYYPAISYFHIARNPAHRWYTFPAMEPHEVVVFKQWDTDASRARCVPHTAFVDPTSRPDAASRMSIEVRVFALR